MNNPAANRYAEAFFYLSEELGKTDAYFEQLSQASDAIVGNREFFDCIRSPFVSGADKKSIIEKVFENQFSREVMNFLKILIDKNRISSLADITGVVKALIDDKNNVVEGEVISAIKLDQSVITKLEEKLSKKYYKTIKLENKVDERIIGGLLVKIGNEEIDGTIKRRLERVSEELSFSY